MKIKSNINRRTFVKGIAAAGVLASTKVSLNASQIFKNTTKDNTLKGNEFHLTIDRTSVNFTGKPAFATTVNAIEWSKNFGNTKDFSPLNDTYLSAGVRVWF